jgi:hypothetical protein
VIRPIALAKLAVQAEAVRLRALAARTAVRALLAVLALVFLLAAVVFAHIAAWFWLDRSALASAGILGGTDLLLAVLCGCLAARSTPGTVEREAVAIRRQAFQEIASQIALVRLVAAVLRLLAGMRQRPRG